MTITYQMATRQDMAELCTFRWWYAYKIYRYDRIDMRSFKSDFHYFLKDELGKLYRCMIAKEGDEIVGTIYWRVVEYVLSYRDTRKVKSAYIKYLDVMPTDNKELALELLRQVKEICESEQVMDMYALRIKPTKEFYLASGFELEGDCFKLQLINDENTSL